MARNWKRAAVAVMVGAATFGGASAAWAQELSLMSPRVLARLNDGRKGRVREIRWIAGPLGRRS